MAWQLGRNARYVLFDLMSGTKLATQFFFMIDRAIRSGLLEAGQK